MKGIGRRWQLLGACAMLPFAAPASAQQSTGDLVACNAAPGETRPWLNPAHSAECRAEFVLRTFDTVEAKLAVLTAGAGRGTDWLTALGLPALRGGDGPAGIRNGGVGVTSFPTPLTVAASFDRATATLYGDTLAQEFVDFGFNRMGGPALDIARSWNFGRVSESFGEDPFLTGAIAAPQVRAIQGRHVLSMVKHYAVYTQEQGRAGDHPLRTRPAVNAVVSERAIREIYLPGFEAAIREGGVGQVMCSFPRINGVYACEHPQLLGILKQEWGFDGQVVPDFPDAQRSIVAAVAAGLDGGYMVGQAQQQAGPGGSLATVTDNSFNGEDLRVAVAKGEISTARVDDLIRRRLVPQFRIGAFDHPATRVAADVSTPERRRVAAEIVARGAVLLKNEGGILPLAATAKTIAVIGHQAGPGAVVAEMGSAHVAPMHLAPVLPAIRQRAGTASVLHAPGTLGLDRLPLVPTGMVRGAGDAAGFTAEYFANADLDFAGKPFLSRQEAAVDNLTIPTDAAFPANRAWSVRWRGSFTPTEDGIQHFTLAGSGTARLFVDGTLAGRFDNTDFGDTIYANVPMRAGRPVAIRVEWTPRVTFRQAAVDDYGTTLGPALRLGWAGPNRLIDDAVAAARASDVAIVFVGHRVGEGMDRQSLALPSDQDALIQAVAAANPNTVVVLQTGGPVTMPWLPKVRAVLEMWLPGDAFGPAAAALLFGDAEPGGRLPVTFPLDESQGPARRPAEYPGRLSRSGALDDVVFAEGHLVGYRYWDAHGQTPLFPFGHGLSYTRFDTMVGAVRQQPDGRVALDVTVHNVGGRTGSEVIQAYVGLPARTGAAPRQLKGFQKVTLMPGERRTVTIDLPRDAFHHWDERRHAWMREAGTYRIMVGRSSRDILHTATIRLPADRGRPSGGP
ncbi:glycoside hydrolase family 3 C-terminal domain-containing protein [Sphingomonas sp. HF-S3]|uniref:Glycoside hydrolase family 3 C-terminal domain-containing protein n=1 Tax=Sphingomonas rustica TaxID=3103142 RepID=A0ABV0B8S1_9SPHN